MAKDLLQQRIKLVARELARAHGVVGRNAVQKTLRLFLVVSCLVGTAWSRVRAQDSHPPPTTRQAAPTEGGATSLGAHSAPPAATARYELPPEKRAKAVAYSRARYISYFAGVAISLAIYWLLWRGGLAVAFRNWASKVSPKLFVQCLVFVPLFLGVVSLLEFPLAYYSDFALEHRFDLSTQGFGAWLGDWGKNLAINVILGIIVVWIFYALVRRSPGRWWFYSWLVSLPIALVLILAEPYVVESLFYNFTPLEKTQPALTARIEQMLGHAGLTIPRSRIFEMNASTKTRTVDAYVSGLGASKRVVIWDTTLKKMGADETLLVVGHEAGHYILHHIPKELALIEMILLVLFYLGFVAVNRIVEGASARSGGAGVGDLASLPIVLLVLGVLVFLVSPIFNGISRHYEHQADQFGLEIASGVVADPNAADVRSFQVLGAEDLADPDPGPFIKFCLYSHPTLEERIRFAATYRPWAEGKPLEWVHPRNP